MEFDACLCLYPQNVLDVISLISRLNSTKTTSFNLVLFTNVDDVKAVKEHMIEGGAADTQTAHFYVKNVPQRREKTDNIVAFLILVKFACFTIQITPIIIKITISLFVISLKKTLIFH